MHDNKDLNLHRYCAAPSLDAARSFNEEDENHAYYHDDAELKLIQAHAPPEIMEEKQTLMHKQPHVSSPRWLQLVLLSSRLPPCFRDLHDKGFVQ